VAPSFAGSKEADAIKRFEKAKQELIVRQQEWQAQADNEQWAKLQQEKEAFQARLREQAAFQDILNIPLIQFHGKNYSGLDILTLLAAESKRDSLTQRVATSMVMTAFAAVTAGIPLLFPRFLKTFRDRVFKPGVRHDKIQLTFNSYQHQYNHLKLEIILNMMEEQGYLRKLPGADEGGFFSRKWVLTEKALKTLAQNPDLTERVVKDAVASFQEAAEIKKSPEGTFLGDPLTKPLTPEEEAKLPHYQALQQLLFTRHYAENAWDLLKRLNRANESIPYYKWIFNSGIPEDVWIKQVGNPRSDWFRKQIDSLRSLGLVKQEGDFIHGSSRPHWVLTPKGKEAVKHADPFGAGLLTHNQFLKILELEELRLQSVVREKEEKVRAMEAELAKAQKALSEMEAEQQADLAKAKELLTQSSQPGLAETEMAKLKGQAAVLAHAISCRKQAMATQGKLVESLPERLLQSWARFHAYVKVTQQTQFNLRTMALQLQAGRVNDGLADMGENLQALQAGQDRDQDTLNQFVDRMKRDIQEEAIRAEVYAELGEKPLATTPESNPTDALKQLLEEAQQDGAPDQDGHKHGSGS
jgi:hypothetical protein